MSHSSPKPEILFSDDHLIILNKPAGLLSIADRHDDTKPHALSFLRHQSGPNVLPVHRLDRGTSGLLLFARTAQAQRELSRQFADQQVFKHYQALVMGRPEPPNGCVDQPIGAHPNKPGTMRITAKGKPSLTDYQVIESFRHQSWLSIFPRTGRTHQIRVHLAYIGHPLVGDPQYGGLEHLLLSTIKKGYRPSQKHPEQPLLQRVALHCHELRFHHPATGEEMTWQSDLPKDLAVTLRQLRRWSA